MKKQLKQIAILLTLIVAIWFLVRYIAAEQEADSQKARDKLAEYNRLVKENARWEVDTCSRLVTEKREYLPIFCKNYYYKP